MSVSGYLIGSQAAGQEPLPPAAELHWWYQFYFATERGRAGYDKYRHEFAKLIWHTASPKWDFDDATFDRTAAAFDNPDHVDIVIHNYRWRLGLAAGEAQVRRLRNQLAAAPVITVPDHHLGRRRQRRAASADRVPTGRSSPAHTSTATITGGIGHNLPQEAPHEFAQAVIDASHY